MSLHICQGCGSLIDDRWPHTCSHPKGNTLRYFARLLNRQDDTVLLPCMRDA